jgi:hypothetical protein
VRRLAVLSVLACLVTAGLAGAPDPAGAELTPLPQGFSQWVGCAADGAGEVVTLSGALRVATRTEELGGGGWLATSTFNPRGVVGTGGVTGDTYRGVGHTGSTTVSTTSGQRITQTNSFLLVAPGPDNNLVAHTTWHLTVLADGTVVGEVTNVTLECR